jgi:hypothetical protein
MKDKQRLPNVHCGNDAPQKSEQPSRLQPSVIRLTDRRVLMSAAVDADGRVVVHRC